MNNTNIQVKRLDGTPVDSGISGALGLTDTLTITATNVNALVVEDAGGNDVFVVDTTNKDVKIGDGNDGDSELVISGDIILRGDIGPSNQRTLWFGDKSVTTNLWTTSDSHFFIQYTSNNNGSFSGDELKIASARATGGGIDGARDYIIFNSTSGDISIPQMTTITDTTASTTKDTGSLVVEGGVGIEKSLNVGIDINATGDITGDIIIANNEFCVPNGTVSDPGIAFGGTSNNTGLYLISEDRIGITNDSSLTLDISSTEITSKVDLVSEGVLSAGDGTAIAADPLITMNLFGTDSWSLGQADTNTGVANLGLKPNVDLSKFRIRNQNNTNLLSVVSDNSGAVSQVFIHPLAESTSPTVGAFLVQGGCGIAKNLSVGGNINIDSIEDTVVMTDGIVPFTLTTDDIRYNQIGKQVSGSIDIVWSARTSSAVNVDINLPFTATSTNNVSWLEVHEGIAVDGGSAFTTLQSRVNGSNIEIWEQSVDGSSTPNRVQANDFNSTGSLRIGFICWVA